MKLDNIQEIDNKFMILSNHKYKSFDNFILKTNISKTYTIKHSIKYYNEYYTIKVNDTLMDMNTKDLSNTVINKNYNLNITKNSQCKNYINLDNYEYNIRSIKNYFLLINKKVINLNSQSIKYSYNNFIHKKLGDLLYLTINLEKTDISEFIWNTSNNTSIKDLILEDKFNWETSIVDLIIHQGCPLFGVDNFNNIKIIGIYYCKTINYVNNEYEPLLWFIPSYTIIKLLSQIYNKRSLLSNQNIIDNYEIKDNKIILTNDYKIADTILIPKNSILISYNNKMLLYGDSIKDKINIKFSTYQNYDPITRICFNYRNKYYIKNIYNEVHKKKIYNRIPVYYNYNIDKLSCYNYNGFIFMRLSLEFINYVLNSNLIIDSYIISQLLTDPYTNFSELYTYCLISCPDQYINKHDDQTYLYKVLSNLVVKYIHITKYLEDRPQMIYLPIIKGSINFNKPIKSLNLLIDTDNAYRINL